MRPTHLLAATLLASLALPAYAAPSIIYDFTSGAGGWFGVSHLQPDTVNGYDTPTTTPYAAGWVAGGGNPGPFIHMDDHDADFSYFHAPALGDLSPYIGGSISWDLRDNAGTINQPAVSNIADVVLIGFGLTLVIDAGPDPIAGVPLGAWTSLSVPLDPTQWKINNLASGLSPTPVQFQLVLQNLTSLDIRGEQVLNFDSFDLDNVVISGPEPTSLATLAIGALFLTRKNRRA